ncbi:hypothetical protein DBR44_09600 [Aquitalea sp. FJL05]|jgi:hypothetical protein|nr:hypothetical protein DBR44_09600 [Aquitalea sp. FJL05]
MIRLESDLNISFAALQPEQDLLEKDSSQEKLFKTIATCLKEHEILNGYVLGRLGNHEEYSLFKNSGYWIVAFSERGKHEACGVFMDYFDATEMFLCKMIRPNPFFDWKKVFE